MTYWILIVQGDIDELESPDTVLVEKQQGLANVGSIALGNLAFPVFRCVGDRKCLCNAVDEADERAQACRLDGGIVQAGVIRVDNKLEVVSIDGDLFLGQGCRQKASIGPVGIRALQDVPQHDVDSISDFAQGRGLCTTSDRRVRRGPTRACHCQESVSTGGAQCHFDFCSIVRRKHEKKYHAGIGSLGAGKQRGTNIMQVQWGGGGREKREKVT